MENAFISAYFGIDKSLKGRITPDELEEYRRKKNYEKAFVQKWLRLFDRQSTGVITLEEFCDVLGLEVKKVQEQHATHVQTKRLGKWPPSDVHIISVDMDEEDQKSVVQFAREAVAKFKDEQDIANYVHEKCEQTWDSLWQIVVLLGQYWSKTSHEPKRSFHFRLMDRYIFLTWRTPYS